MDIGRRAIPEDRDRYRQMDGFDQGSEQGGMKSHVAGISDRDAMKLPRRKFLQLAAGVAALPAMSRMASAQAYPARPVTIVVPFAAGGGTDVSARIVGEYMARTLGQQFIIENVVGAGGTTGSLRAMRARPDGYTILMGHIGT